MATPSSLLHNDLFSSLISDIKSYSGKDPLLPWLRGIKRMKESLAPSVLKEKLPRFLQKCTQAFKSDRRYKNDLRYLRVWLQLMDYVDEPRVLLRTMEFNGIGTQRSLFYQAYALYYEKRKKFEEAEKMYHLGVKNLAEPANELQKSYGKFLDRMERHKKKIQQHEGRTGKRPLSASNAEENDESMAIVEDRPKKVVDRSSQNSKPLRESNHMRVSSVKNENFQKIQHGGMSKQIVSTVRELDGAKMSRGDDTVVVKFVDTAIVGKSEAEDACHHGLVDPTINLREAMNAINSMFREPIETATGRRSHRNLPKECGLNSGFDVFIDDNLDDETEPSCQKEAKKISMMPFGGAQTCQPQQEPFQIFIDDEESGENDNLGQSDACRSSASHLNAFVFPCPKDLPSDDIGAKNSPQIKLREDTVVHRFVGSTISDDPAVENVCHHGLVDPTINLREAMDDINNMFGKPIEFVRTNRQKRKKKRPITKQDVGGFSILPDDDLEHQQDQAPARISRKRDTDLFEPTVFTKEALDDINKMFAMPMDF